MNTTAAIHETRSQLRIDVFTPEGWISVPQPSVAAGERRQLVLRLPRAGAGADSTNRYVRELVRADQRRRARAELEAALLEGLAGPREVATPDFWNSVREEAARLSTEGQAAPPKSYSFDL